MRSWSIVQGLLALSPLFSTLLAQDLVQQLCSSQNVADTPASFWEWNSNGHCLTVCSGYAFAVVQYQSCWCTDYAPYDQLSVSDCGATCPGFPPENCGNRDNNLFGYVAVPGKQPAGTLGAPAPSSPPPPPSSSKAAPTSEPPAPTSEPPADVPAPVASVRVVTVNNGASVVTEFVTWLPAATTPSSSENADSNSGRGSSTGTIAGAVVGGVGGVAVLAGGLWFLLARRRRRNENDDDFEHSQSGSTPRRNVSTLSRTGLLRSGSEKFPTIAVPAATLRRGSNGDSNHSDITSPLSARRNSQPLFYDQRLNPSALMNLENGSRTSMATIEDNRDYTRTLNVRNPDPPEHTH